MGRTLSHQIRQIIYMVLTQLLNSLLFRAIILRADNIIHPPFITAGSAEHTAHQMIAAIRMGKGMERIKLIHAKLS